MGHRDLANTQRYADYAPSAREARPDFLGTHPLLAQRLFGFSHIPFEKR